MKQYLPPDHDTVFLTPPSGGNKEDKDIIQTRRTRNKPEQTNRPLLLPPDRPYPLDSTVVELGWNNGDIDACPS